MGLSNILFILILSGGIIFFIRNIKKLNKSIKQGKPITVDDKPQRWKNMIGVALGQSKMTVKPISGLLHIIVYVGFFIINLEVLEIILDGILGTHRIFSFTGAAYDILIALFEILALLVIVSIVIFWIRRNILNISRFLNSEITSWPKKDANYILYFELVLMILFLLMNTFDYMLQFREGSGYPQAGNFVLSKHLMFFFTNLDTTQLIVFERVTWWLHIIGILVFLNYLYYSKHLHILLAFPNTFYASILPKGRFENLKSVTQEVHLMLGISSEFEDSPPDCFGASDIKDLSQLQLMSAYACTECGRCTDECPANKTGKKLSPRKIMMDVRDRLEDLSKGKNKEQKLLGNYISEEELWACTTCNACVDACPVSISPLSIIMDMRQFLIMEESSAPTELNTMMTNIENNGTPWAYSASDRLNWIK